MPAFTRYERRTTHIDAAGPFYACRLGDDPQGAAFALLALHTATE